MRNKELKNRILEELNDYICDLEYLQDVERENYNIEGNIGYKKKAKIVKKLVEDLEKCDII